MWTLIKVKMIFTVHRFSSAVNFDETEILFTFLVSLVSESFNP